MSGILQVLRDNRLKIVSLMSVMADFMMGLAGGVSFFFWSNVHGGGDILLMCGCILGVAGHGALLLWGKGGRKVTKTAFHVVTPIPGLLGRTLRPWRYPLDWAFCSFSVAGLLYAGAGVASANGPLALNGCMTATASMIGWLWPQDKPVMGRNVMQVTAMIYGSSSIVSFFAAWVAHSLFIFLASCFYLSVNAILYTVRKQNQSAYTQQMEA